MGIMNTLRCKKCASAPVSKTIFRCPSCDGVLEVNVEIGHLKRSDFDAMRRNRDHTIWRWFDFFPVEEVSSIVSLGEGCTPLIHATRLGEWSGAHYGVLARNAWAGAFHFYEIAGRFEKRPGTWGPRRMPVAVLKRA